ncbi:CopL family metal-binding regulatory protein [Luteimonas yindakuii]|uniref:CopL family metal-binding regulatory protein n=1 Tax=Luteimonas yindakuii TaxID=2565782 RepID=A0A4Z1R6B2_9GAMM|nr:CopL family metal-binding regulatory protein [Luteimonas yindakuii]TKS54990.1 CopL family metal-binding regulatory protein [Luteimonas yindakuii]
MRPLLLRLFLCITLLLNGIGSGMASVHVQLGALAGDAVAEAMASAADPDCPHAGGAVPSPAPALHPAAPGPGDTDCLKLCMDLSLQPAQALATPPGLLPAAQPPDAPAMRATAGVASAARPPPLRPPIRA